MTCRLFIAVAVAAALAGCGGGGGTTGAAPPPPVSTTVAVPPGPPQGGGTVVRVDRTWTCRGPVDLDAVRVTMTSAAARGPRRNADAVHLRPGCTGRIGRLEVTQSAGDGVKVADGAHDLEIGGGYVRCLAKAPTLHQDGVQVMGGDRITFRGLTVDCGRPGARLVNSNFFVKEAGRSAAPPTDVVCVRCSFGGDAAHTVSIQQSVRSGVRDSTFCPARYPRLTFTIGPQAADPVTAGNVLGACAGADRGRPVTPGAKF